MSETLKRDFYAACPIWYWPVLWWQFIVMEQYLADLYAATGRVQMSYGLALGPRGSLHLVHLSDTARHFAMHGQMPAESWAAGRKWALTSSSPDHPCNGFIEARFCAPRHSAPTSPQFYLDPG